jgi:SPP1 family phage portal protein
MARLGSFETVLSLLDALNNLDSNNLDSVEQTVQSLLVATNCDFDEGVTANSIRESGMVMLKSVGDVKADIKVIGETLKQTDTETLKQSIIQAIYEIAGIPSQGNGSTGDSSNNGAIVLKNGGQGAETKAQDFEMMFREPEQRSIELMCDLCKRLGGLNLDSDKVDVKFTRRNYEDLLSKSQTLITMLGSDKIHPQCAYEACGLFVDVQDAYNMGMEWYEKQKAEEEAASAPTESGVESGGNTDDPNADEAAKMDGHKAGEQSAQGTWISGYWQKRGDRK